MPKEFKPFLEGRFADHLAETERMRAMNEEPNISFYEQHGKVSRHMLSKIRAL